MTFERYFKASSYCIIAAGFVAVAGTGALDWISVILFSAALIGSSFLDTAKLRRLIPSRTLNWIALAYIPWFAVDYMLLSRSLLIAAVHLIFFTAAVKLMTLSGDRDYLLLYLISFAELLAASTLTVNIVFALCLLGFLISGICTLVLFEMRRTNARMQDQTRVRPLVVPKKLRGSGFELFSPFPAGLLSAMVVGMALMILVIAIPIFFLLPRVTLSRYMRPTGKTQFLSGFSERVILGQIGTIKLSDAVVMRVKIDNPVSQIPYDLKWRGIAFDCYDGRSWIRSNVQPSQVRAQGKSYYKLENSTQGTTLLDQTFFIEALSTNVVFAAHKALAVSRDVGPLQRDSAESLYTEPHYQRKLRYTAVSDPIRPDPANISDLAPIPPEILSSYLQLPPEDPRIGDLARKISAVARNRYAKAQAVEQYLRSHYTYSLVLSGPPNSKDPLATFLFDVRRGHCEYFASAMTIMLRTLQIPARLVNGFRTGEYNRIGNDFTVRQYDAHSWVEAYFPPYGWVEFDPTPPDPTHYRSAFTRWLDDLSDAFTLWWWEGVVNYDPSKQLRFVVSLRSGIENVQQGIGKFVVSAAAVIHSPTLPSLTGRRWIYGTLLIPFLVLALLKSWRMRIFSLSRRIVHRRNRRAVAASFYAEALALLGAHGIRRRQAQTPMEFAQSLGQHPASDPFLALTRIYNAVRFGPPGVPFRNSEAESLLRSLRRSLHQR
jgi:hypothetical protein